MSLTTLRILMPEIVLMVVAVAIYLGGAFCHAKTAWSWLAGGALAVTAALLATQSGSVDGLAWFGQWLAIGFGMLLVLMTAKSGASNDASESVGSMLLTIAGLMFVAGANELILLFVGLELISIPTYVLLYLGGHDTRSQEATVKYFFLSVLSSAVLLYGFSTLYGVTGSTVLLDIYAAMDGHRGMITAFGPLAKMAMVLIFAGLCFKITAVPFHFYAPDVYQGASYSNTSLLSVVPKAAGLFAMVRLLVWAMPSVEIEAWHIVLIVSIATMTLGNVLALWQDNLRRMLAYSSIANAGYLLIGLAVGLAQKGSSSYWDGVSALNFYLVVYGAATVGTFAVLQYLGRPDRSLEGVDELAGLGRTHRWPAAMLAVFLFSLSGVPPLAGFWGKLLLFGSALNVGGPWFIALAIVGVLNAAVAAAYYLRLVGVMYFRTPLGRPPAQGGRGALWAAAFCLIAVAVVGNVVYPVPLSLKANPTRVEVAGNMQAAGWKP